jgi:hypothetical protein
MPAAFPRLPLDPARRRICLVVPPVTAEDRYGPMAAAGNSLPPHAFLYLGAVARALGWEVRIVDGPAHGLTPRRLRRRDPRARPGRRSASRRRR